MIYSSMKHHSRIKRNELLIQSSQPDLQTQCILNQNLNRGMCMGIIKTGKVILKLTWEYKGPKRTKEVSKKRKAVAHALICEKSRLTLKLQQLRGCSISTETDRDHGRAQGSRNPHQQGFLVYNNGVTHSSGERIAFLTVNGSNGYQLSTGGVGE